MIVVRAGMAEDFAACVRRSPVMLTEGAVIERLRRDATVPLDPHILHSGLIYSARGSGRENDMAEPKAGWIKETLAVICSHCPVCNHARAHPESLVGRVLHHPLHADHCPFWKAEREVAGWRAGGRE